MTDKKYFQDWLSKSQADKVKAIMNRFHGISYKSALACIPNLDREAQRIIDNRIQYRPNRRTLARRNRA